MLFTPSHIEYNTNNLQEPTYMRTHTDFPLSILLSRFLLFLVLSPSCSINLTTLCFSAPSTWYISIRRRFEYKYIGCIVLLLQCIRWNIFSMVLHINFRISCGIWGDHFFWYTLAFIPLASIRINLIFWSLFNNKHQWLTYAFEYLRPISTFWNLGQKVTQSKYANPQRWI